MTMQNLHRRNRRTPKAHHCFVAGLALLALPTTAVAQEREPRRVRVALGPEFTPSFPGASSLSLGPFIEVDMARGADPFEFEAPDESFGFPVLSLGGVEVGPSLSIESKRDSDDVAPGLRTVKTAVELGGFIQYFPAKSVRLRADIGQGVSGHKALLGTLSADWIARDGDKWLVSLGPRVIISSARYQRTYFGISPAESAASGLPAYTAGGGIQSVGATAGAIRQIDKRWSLHGYVRYDRLVGDAAESPIVRDHGSRNQFSSGVALSYTFGAGAR